VTGRQNHELTSFARDDQGLACVSCDCDAGAGSMTVTVGQVKDSSIKIVNFCCSIFLSRSFEGIPRQCVKMGFFSWKGNTFSFPQKPRNYKRLLYQDDSTKRIVHVAGQTLKILQVHFAHPF
jgi:hypothetical protein